MSAAGWRKAMVVLQDPVDPAAVPDQARRNAMRRQAAAASCEELLGRLRDAGLEGDARLPEPGVMSSLIVEASPRALDEIRKGSQVKDVLPLDDGVRMDVI